MTKQLPNTNSDSSEEREFSHDKMAALIMGNTTFLTYSDTHEVLYYDKSSGIYKQNGEELIQQKVESQMAHLGLSTKCTSHYVSEVTGHIQRLTYKQRKDFNRFPAFLTLKNGTLDLTDQFVLTHSKEFRATIAVPIIYNKDAQCPAITKFLNEIVKPEDVPLLLEIIGWCLDADSGMQKLVMMLGSGANGKSTFLELLRAFIGPDNCSSVSLHQLTENKFSMAELYNKLVNIFGDLPAKGIKDVAPIKMLTGGDAMQAERKFQDPFSFVNKAKLIFSMNQLPSLPEDNLAIWRRLMLIDFPNQFTGTDADKNLLAKLTTEEELSGLLNLALQHLKDVQTKGEFSYFRTIDEVRREYLLKTDPALVFIKERCTEVSDSYISKENMYQAFVSFCQELKRPAPGKNQFGARLKSLDIVSERQDDWGIHEWVGLKLK